MNKLLKTYLYVMILLGMVIIIYFLSTKTFTFSIAGSIFALLTAYAQCKDDLNGNLSIAMTASSYVFLTACFGVFYAIAAYSIAMTLNFTIKYKNEASKKDNDSEKEDVHLFVKIFYNISAHALQIAGSYFLIKALNIDYHNVSALWKITAIMLLYNAINIMTIMMIASISMGRLYKEILSLQKMDMYYFYNQILAIALILAYVDRGAIGALIIYSMFFPLQKTVLLYMQLKTQQEDLFTDTLTGAYNLRFFKQVVENQLTKKQKFSIIMIDLDKFKMINDTFGHLAGDKVLIEFSRIIKQKIIKDNYFCRNGGDEFTIVLNENESAIAIAEQILGVLQDYEVDFNGNKLKILLSMGIYEYDGADDLSIGDVIEKVDEAMYSAKKQGGNKLINYINI